jgi:hypothetical protein
LRDAEIWEKPDSEGAIQSSIATREEEQRPTAESEIKLAHQSIRKHDGPQGEAAQRVRFAAIRLGKPMLTPYRLLSRSMVDIYVGPENTHWILHEKLLCAKSKFFSKIFWDSASNRFSKNRKGNAASHESNKSFGLPEEDEEPFKLFVGWLYSSHVPVPTEEKDLGNLFELYLMGEKWAIAGLVKDVLDTVRGYYRTTGTYPGLRRVQYIYANTDASSPMRQLLVGSIARMLVLGEGVPAHWDKALRKNGQLAVDIIMAVQQWKIDPETVPDAREGALAAEKEKVKVVEKLESEQTGKARLLGENAKEKSEEKPNAPQQEEKPLTNGVPQGEEDEEADEGAEADEADEGAEEEEEEDEEARED